LLQDRPNPIGPSVAIRESVHYCEGGMLVAAFSNTLGFLNREGFPILDTNVNTLMGVRLPSFEQMIDEDSQAGQEIEKRLKKAKFFTRYTKGEGWVKSKKLKTVRCHILLDTS
jgi:hypothetical protein